MMTDDTKGDDDDTCRTCPTLRKRNINVFHLSFVERDDNDDNDAALCVYGSLST